MHLMECFKSIQQLPCKAIAKEYIKTVEPRKQTTHPYKRGDSAKPNWWPLGVRHTEPDHLKKDERLELLVSIMMHCITGRIKVGLQTLRDSTNGVKRSLLNGTRLKILDEIFYLAREKKRFDLDSLSGHDVEDALIEVSDFDKVKSSLKVPELNLAPATPKEEDRQTSASNEFEEYIDFTLGVDPGYSLNCASSSLSH
jgi:hypothetical protein